MLKEYELDTLYNMLILSHKEIGHINHDFNIGIALYKDMTLIEKNQFCDYSSILGKQPSSFYLDALDTWIAK